MTITIIDTEAMNQKLDIYKDISRFEIQPIETGGWSIKLTLKNSIEVLDQTKVGSFSEIEAASSEMLMRQMATLEAGGLPTKIALRGND